VVVHLRHRPSSETLAELAALGVSFEQDGLRGRTLAATVSRSALAGLRAHAEVVGVELDGLPVPTPRPLDLTQQLIHVDAVHRAPVSDGGLPLTGSGMTVCDVDSGIDVFHPMFFRADLGLYDFDDEDDNGFFDAGVDTIVWNGASVRLRVLDGVVIDRGSGEPLFGTEGTTLDLQYDYLYADLDDDGVRDVGPDAGFTEATPTYGEQLFVVDDVDGDGELSVGEKIAALGTSKIKAFRFDGETYERGKNLIDAPWLEEMQHGNGAAGVLVAGQPGFKRLVGMAPDADLIMAAERGGGRELMMTNFCINRGATVVLHEYAPWIGYHLDGSSALEALIDESSVEGVVHVNPAGNLSTSQKMMKRTLDPSGTTVIPIEFPPNGSTYFVGTFLWRDTSRNPSFKLDSASGASVDLGTGMTPVQEIFDGKTIFAFREDSSRGTGKLDVYLVDEVSPIALVPGTYTLTVTEGAGLPPLELIGSVFDEVSGWGQGVRFLEDVTEDHLIGWPGTADRGLAVAAYVGHDFPGISAGPSGERAYYSGRGHRIDDVPLMWISAPDNPIVPATYDDHALGYLVYGGTSGASPHVAGSAVLLQQADPSLDGEGVKERIRETAITDSATGAVPNDDFGWGKLDTYRAIFGADAPTGTPPTIEAMQVSLPLGSHDVPLVIADAEDPLATLLVEVDADYDGVVDETVPADAPLTLQLDQLGDRVMKLRVVDPSGRSGTALLRVTVTEEEPEPEPEPTFDPSYYPAGGCVLASTERSSAPPPGLVVFALAALVAGRRRGVFSFGRAG
jgi:hypothetical protein